MTLNGMFGENGGRRDENTFLLTDKLSIKIEINICKVK